MRFVLKAVFWLVVVGLFMPSDAVRASLPDLPSDRARAQSEAAAEISRSGAALCERSPETCQAIGESRVLAEIAGAAVEIGVRQMLGTTRQPDRSAEPAEADAPEAAGA